jgi:hypothetical protein
MSQIPPVSRGTAATCRVFLALTFVLVSSVSCSTDVTGPSVPLLPSVLNTNAGSYDGKSVSVKGFVILAPEAHDLYESKELNAELAKNFGPPVNGRFDLTVC